MDEDRLNTLLAKYDRPVPRYTSFPTAVQFTPSISRDFHEEQLKNLRPDEPVSLYIHIPFCHSLCHYCGCHTKIVNTTGPIENYIHSLMHEIRLAGEKTAAKIPVRRIHFGGGSPNYPETKLLAEILDLIGKVFKCDHTTQIDMECDPRLLDREKIEAYARMGLSRVSLGIQDFDETVQTAINRIQPFELVRDCVEHLRENGITRINFDLMTGLPEQTLDSVASTVEKAISLHPSRIAVFPYAHVPWMKKHQKLLEKYTLPDAQMRFRMHDLVHKRLIGNGYKAIGIDHYALPDDPLHEAMKTGHLKRNFQGYTDDSSDTIIGFGLSAISLFKSVYVQNTTNSGVYRKSLEQDLFPIQRGCRLSPEDKTRRGLIEKLMCDFVVNEKNLKNLVVAPGTLSSLQDDQLIAIEEDQLMITDLGRPFARIVASCFDPYLKH